METGDAAKDGRTGRKRKKRKQKRKKATEEQMEGNSCTRELIECKRAEMNFKKTFERENARTTRLKI